MVARGIGYAGCQYRELEGKLQPLYARFEKHKVQAAVYHLATFEGQMTSTPKALAHVELRPEARKLCWGLLGPPPERREEFNRPTQAPPPLKGPPEPPHEKPKRTRKEKRP